MGVLLTSITGLGYYIRQNYYLKVKAIDKLEIILSDDEFQRRDSSNSSSSALNKINQYIAIHSDDKTTPLAILSPKRPERVKKILKQIAKSNIGILCTDQINDFNNHIDPENDLKINNHFVVLNPQNMKSFKIIEDQMIARIGVGWRIHELNKNLMKYGYYLPIDKLHNNQTIFDLINQDEGKLRHPIYKFFKHIVGDMLVFLANGEAQIGTHNVGTGINLKELFFGSNANIGIPTELDVRIFPIPQNFHKMTIHFNEFISWNQINLILQNLQNIKQYSQSNTYLQVTPNEKKLVIQFDKYIENSEIIKNNLLNKWKINLLKGSYLEKSLISNIELERDFIQNSNTNNCNDNADNRNSNADNSNGNTDNSNAKEQKQQFNIDFSFLLLKENQFKEMTKFQSYLKDNSKNYSDYELQFDITNKMINLSLNYNENNEDLLRHKDYLMNQQLQPVYLKEEEEPLISPWLQQNIGMFKYIQQYWNPVKSDFRFQNIIKKHPVQASPLIQEDPRKSFAKKLINHVVNDYGQLIYCSNVEIKNFFKKQDLFFNYGLHGSRLQLELYKFFDKNNILYNPIFCQKEIFDKKYITFK